MMTLVRFSLAPCVRLLACAALTATSLGQTEVLQRIDRPSVPAHGWGRTLEPLEDIDGDGVPELAVGQLRHAIGGRVATVHSGATGDLLYDLVASPLPLF